MLIHLALVVLLVQGCCQPEPSVESMGGQMCPENRHYDPQQGCVCDTSLIPLWEGGCLVDNGIYYLGKFDSCNCINEILLEAPIFNTTVFLNYNAFRVTFKNSFYRSTQLDYPSFYKKWDGDSISAYNIIYPYCDIKGQQLTAFFAGKFMGTDTIDGWVKWCKPQANYLPPPVAVDSCHAYFIKLKK